MKGIQISGRDEKIFIGEKNEEKRYVVTVEK